ncbi:MAG: hypothetical protein JWM57_1547 [Phycisphaerales bacterium]|nr:hypothetical protein [Phycisphaerales bacterium]
MGQGRMLSILRRRCKTIIEANHQITIISNLVKWFVNRAESEQNAVLGTTSNAKPTDAARPVLQQIAEGVRSVR